MSIAAARSMVRRASSEHTRKMAPRLLKLTLAACMHCIAVEGWSPSCQECVTAIDAARGEWRKLEASLLADLPAMVCHDCPLPQVCASGVESFIQALNASIEESNGTHLCEVLSLCSSENATTPALPVWDDAVAWL